MNLVVVVVVVGIGAGLLILIPVMVAVPFRLCLGIVLMAVLEHAVPGATQAVSRQGYGKDTQCQQADDHQAYYE